MKQENVTCPFDKKHVIPESSLERHIKKCKSQNKRNFQQCRHNPKHWVNFSKLEQHEEKCKKQIDNDDSVLEDMLKEMDSEISISKSSRVEQREEKKRKKKQKKKEEDEEEEMEEKTVKWKEPSFAEWVAEQNPKQMNIMNWADLNEDSFNSDFSCEEMRVQRL